MGERMTIVGTRDVSFTDEKTRKQVEGMSFYYTQALDGVKGLSAGKMFMTLDAVSHLEYVPEPGDEVFVYFNRFGKVSSFVKN